MLAEGSLLTDSDLFAGDFASAGGTSAGPDLSGMFEAGLPLSEVERRHIIRTLHLTRSNRTEAARLLQISIRCLAVQAEGVRAAESAERARSF